MRFIGSEADPSETPIGCEQPRSSFPAPVLFGVVATLRCEETPIVASPGGF